MAAAAPPPPSPVWPLSWITAAEELVDVADGDFAETIREWDDDSVDVAVLSRSDIASEDWRPVFLSLSLGAGDGDAGVERTWACKNGYTLFVEDDDEWPSEGISEAKLLELLACFRLAGAGGFGTGSGH